MRFQLLGPLSITDGADAVVLQPSKPTILLATLLLHANSVVSASYLQRTLWGADQPATAKGALQTCVLRLRRLCTKHGVTDTSIDAVPGGYRVTAGPATLDLLGFREHVRASGRLADDPEAELAALRDALALWQGSVLANVPSDVLHRDEVPRLTEERLRTLERICDLELTLGRYGQALVELWSATRSHPAHERFREQLIEALYRSGRQAEALAEYRAIKRYLQDELGVDPSPSLQRLELAILRGDDLGPTGYADVEAATGGRTEAVPAPAGAASGNRSAAAHPEPRGRSGPAGDVCSAAVGTGLGAPDTASATQTAVARIADVPCFAGRAADTAAMVATLTAADEEPATLLVCGAPGIGKTALARHVAHRVRDRFPGGMLLIGLVRPDGTPRSADEAAAETDAALARAGGSRRGPVLLVLDDVIDADQVRPLLPTGRGDAALVTSRRRLAGLVATHGGRVHRLGAFHAHESHRLMVSALGATRVDAEPAAARRLAAACGHFPLALRITTALLSTRPALRLADTAHWLAEDPVGRLCLPDDPRMSVREALSGALNRLDPRHADAFLRLGALSEEQARHFHAAHAAPLLGTAASQSEAEAVLERLADTGLLEDGPPGPYRMHSLLRAYARYVTEPLLTGAATRAPAGLRTTQIPPQKV
jgi:DNA-binding SARP family transcriptional activator